MSPQAQRSERLAAAVHERGLDLLLVTNLVNVRWLTGFTGSNALAIIGGSGEGALRIFLSDFRYTTQVSEQVPPTWDRREATQELVGPALAEHLPPAGDERLPRVGFEDRAITVHQLERIREAIGDRAELVPAGALVEGLREIKDAGEVSRIREAARLADTALGEVVGQGLVGRTEAQVALDLEVAMRRHGAEAISFPPIVASGPHGALPHAEPRAVPIEAGVLVTIDWGAQLEGYCSDCTRTFATGEVGDDERAVYDVVLEAQETSLAAVRPGRSGREVDAVARDIISAAGHGDAFGHGLGHGVGLEIHEGPRLSRLAPETPLAEGMVLTVEPGIYLPGRFGVRIEDLVVVTAMGSDVLNTLPKDLQVVD